MLGRGDINAAIFAVGVVAMNDQGRKCENSQSQDPSARGGGELANSALYRSRLRYYERGQWLEELRWSRYLDEQACGKSFGIAQSGKELASLSSSL